MLIAGTAGPTPITTALFKHGEWNSKKICPDECGRARQNSRGTLWLRVNRGAGDWFCRSGTLTDYVDATDRVAAIPLLALLRDCPDAARNAGAENCIGRFARRRNRRILDQCIYQVGRAVVSFLPGNNSPLRPL